MVSPAFPPAEHAASIVARLEQARLDAGGRGVVAFDGDGTLWEGDVGNELFEAILDANAVRQAAFPALLEAAHRFGVDAHGTPSDLARSLYAGYAEGKVPEEDTCAMMAWAFAGYTPAEARSFADVVVGRVGLRNRLQPELAAVHAWAESARAIDIFVVSASPRSVIEASIGLVFSRASVIAATPVIENGAYAARVEQPMPYGEGKAQALRAALGDRRVLGAFGDNSFDAAMLALAMVPVAVRPKPALLARAHEVAGMVTIIS